MADLSNVPPEVLQILTHDPPYSEGEKALLQNYILRPDANPVILTAFQKMGVMQGDSAGPFHTDLRYPGANPSNQIGSMPPPPQSDLGIPGLNLPDNLDGLAGLSGLNPWGSGIEEEKANPRAEDYGTIPFPQVLDRPDPGRQSRNQITSDWAGPIGEALNSGGGGLVTPGGVPTSGGTIFIPQHDKLGGPGGGGSSSGISGTNTETQGQPSSATASSGLGGVFDATDPALAKVPGFGGSLPSPGLGGSMTTDWAARRDLELSSVPSDSVFANIPVGEWSKFSYLMSNPNLLAGKLYEGTPATAAMATPMVGAIAELARKGLLQSGDQMINAEGFGSNVSQARMVEDTINAMRGQKGAEVSPRAIYQEAFRRALNTPVEEMSTGDGDPGDLSNQIAITNGYLLLAQPFISEGQQEYFKTKLDRYAQAYAQQVVNGEIDVSYSYPQWLSDHGAQNLLGG